MGKKAKRRKAQVIDKESIRRLGVGKENDSQCS